MKIFNHTLVLEMQIKEVVVFSSPQAFFAVSKRSNLN